MVTEGIIKDGTSLNKVETCKNLFAEITELYRKELLSVEEISVPTLMIKVKEKNRSSFKQNIVDPRIDAELVEPTIKDKPTSLKQTYRLTDKARELMKA